MCRGPETFYCFLFCKTKSSFLPEMGFVYTICEVCDSSVGPTCVKTDW